MGLCTWKCDNLSDLEKGVGFSLALQEKTRLITVSFKPVFFSLAYKLPIGSIHISHSGKAPSFCGEIQKLFELSLNDGMVRAYDAWSISRDDRTISIKQHQQLLPPEKIANVFLILNEYAPIPLDLRKKIGNAYGLEVQKFERRV